MSWTRHNRVLVRLLAVLATLMTVVAVATLPAKADTVHSSVHTVSLTSSHDTTHQGASSLPSASQTTPLSVPSSNVTTPLSGGKKTTLPLDTTQPSSAGVATTGQTPSKVHTHVPGAPLSTQSHKGPLAQPPSPTGRPAVHELKGPFTFYDSANPAGIPSNAQAVAGYVTGPYAWTPQQWAMFPHAAPITIDIIGGDTHAMVEDVEPGGVSVSVIHQWAMARIAQGYTPVIYSSQADYPAVAAAMGNLHWHWWAANPTGSQNVVPGSQATQFAWNGNSNDVSFSTLSPSDLIRK